MGSIQTTLQTIQFVDEVLEANYPVISAWKDKYGEEEAPQIFTMRFQESMNIAYRDRIQNDTVAIEEAVQY